MSIAKPPASLGRTADLVQPALRAAVDRLDDANMRRIAEYQLGWWDADGTPTSGGGGKGVRGALALLAAEAARVDPDDALPGAVAVELVHNFSLLHDDVMDRDVERRHRPTGWVAFGEGAAVLAGTAMLTLAAEQLLAVAPHALPCLLTATQELIAGQSDDLLLESNPAAGLDDVLAMSAGKTAALLACATEIGPLAAHAPQSRTAALRAYGFELGMAFQLVDDVLGVAGDPAATGKSASSDLRSGKRSAPIVAALHAGNDAARRLRQLLEGGPPDSDEEVSLAAKLVAEAGGLDWAQRAAVEHTDRAVASLRECRELDQSVVCELVDVARWLLGRDR